MKRKFVESNEKKIIKTPVIGFENIKHNKKSFCKKIRFQEPGSKIKSLSSVFLLEHIYLYIFYFVFLPIILLAKIDAFLDEVSTNRYYEV